MEWLSKAHLGDSWRLQSTALGTKLVMLPRPALQIKAEAAKTGSWDRARLAQSKSHHEQPAAAVPR